MRRVLVMSTTLGKHDVALKSTLETAVEEVLKNSEGTPCWNYLTLS
jgi:hypothetical protein